MASPVDLQQVNATRQARAPHFELYDVATRDVWLAPDPVTREEHAAFAVDAPLVKGPLGVAAMDRAWFRRAPGAAEDGPLPEREVRGRRFQLVARPAVDGMRQLGDGGPRLLTVDKVHVVEFDPGRPVQVLDLPDGRAFVLLASALRRTPRPRGLPDGWTVRTLRLCATWVVDLPVPTETIWLASGETFQGPVAPPADAVDA